MERKNIAVDVFIWLFAIASVYTLICFIVVMLTDTQFWLFLPGYAIGLLSLISPLLLFVYGGVYLVYKRYVRENFPLAVVYFNFVYLVFLMGSLIYSLIFYK